MELLQYLPNEHIMDILDARKKEKVGLIKCLMRGGLFPSFNRVPDLVHAIGKTEESNTNDNENEESSADD